MSLFIRSANKFPHGLQGLKLWESQILMARYVLKNCNRFKHKDILDLWAGVGIVGMTIYKWTQSADILIVDKPPEIIRNLEKNLRKNQVQEDKIMTCNP